MLFANSISTMVESYPHNPKVVGWIQLPQLSLGEKMKKNWHNDNTYKDFTYNDFIYNINKSDITNKWLHLITIEKKLASSIDGEVAELCLRMRKCIISKVIISIVVVSYMLSWSVYHNVYILYRLGIAIAENIDTTAILIMTLYVNIFCYCNA